MPGQTGTVFTHSPDVQGWAFCPAVTFGDRPRAVSWDTPAPDFVTGPGSGTQGLPELLNWTPVEW